MTEAPHRLRLSLEFVCGAEPIAGRVSDESGACWVFVGWVQLATALEEALDAHQPRGDDAPPGG